MGLVHFVVSVVYTLAGLSAFIAFLLLHYYAGAVFAFITAAISGVTAHINWLHKKRRLNLWYEQSEMSQLFWLGFWVFALGFSGFIYHLVYYLVLQQYTTRMDLVIACIWGIISVKSAGLLMYYAYRYMREASDPPIIANNAEEEES